MDFSGHTDQRFTIVKSGLMCNAVGVSTAVQSSGEAVLDLSLAYRIGGIVGGEFQYECQPATVGEFWYDQFIRGLITNICKDPCKNIRVSPSPMACLGVYRITHPLM